MGFSQRFGFDLGSKIFQVRSIRKTVAFGIGLLARYEEMGRPLDRIGRGEKDRFDIAIGG